VTLRFFVDKIGMVVLREIERSSGYERLDNAAAAGLSLCRFRPATFDGEPTGAWTRIEYVWRLQ
jgi:periplasmic protein TonB